MALFSTFLLSNIDLFLLFNYRSNPEYKDVSIGPELHPVHLPLDFSI